MLEMNYMVVAGVIGRMLGCINGSGTNNVNPLMNILSIYSGTIPTVDNTYVWNPANYAAQMLYQKAGITTKTISSQTLPSNSTNITNFVSGVTLSAAIANVLATGTGTATWYAIHNGSANQPVIIGSCTSEATATDTMLLNTTNLVSGLPFTVLDLTIKLIAG